MCISQLSSVPDQARTSIYTYRPACRSSHGRLPSQRLSRGVPSVCHRPHTGTETRTPHSGILKRHWDESITRKFWIFQKELRDLKYENERNKGQFRFSSNRKYPALQKRYMKPRLHSEAKLLLVIMHPLVNHIWPRESFVQSSVGAFFASLVWVSSGHFPAKAFQILSLFIVHHLKIKIGNPQSYGTA